MLKQKKQLNHVMLLVLLLFLIGCGIRQIVLHPITDKDFWITTQDGDSTYHMSEYYFNQVLNIKIDNKR